MSRNYLNDEDAVLISRALKHNTNLKVLNLIENNIAEIGFTALRNAVNDTTSLNTVSESNHTCYIYGVDFGDSPKNTHLGSGHTASVYSHTARYNRRRKLYHLLSVRNREGSNVRHLNLEFRAENDEDDDSIKLVPKVLESINRSSPIAKPLSILYEITRSWKMPELYEGR